MRKEISTGIGAVAVSVASSLLLASCSAPPSQTTTIKVEVPATTEANRNAEKETEIADLRQSDDVDSDKPAVQIEKESAPAPAAKSKSVPAAATAPRKSKSRLLDFYDRLPSKRFAAFGGVNRRSLLARKGAIVDYKYNFIEIPGSNNSDDGDLYKLQITLFPNGDEPWCAVSRIVWPRGKTPGALDFYYGESDDFDRHPRTAAEGFFPYELGRVDGAYQSAFLPRRGLDIVVGVAEDAESPTRRFRYNRKAGVGEPAFNEIG